MMFMKKLIKKPKTVIVVGCGRLGASLAGSMSEQGYNVIIVDKDEDSVRKLPESFSGYEIIADATDIDVLERADILGAEMLVATTDSDNVNSLIAQIASRIYGVSKVFIRLNDTEKEKLIDGFNIEVIYPFKLSVGEFNRLVANTSVEVNAR